MNSQTCHSTYLYKAKITVTSKFLLTSWRQSAAVPAVPIWCRACFPPAFGMSCLANSASFSSASSCSSSSQINDTQQSLVCDSPCYEMKCNFEIIKYEGQHILGLPCSPTRRIAAQFHLQLAATQKFNYVNLLMAVNVR